MTTTTPTSTPRSGSGAAIAAILAISAAASLFLFWLIYIHPAAASSAQFAFLPALNAMLNGLAATALLIGYTFIRARRIPQHRAAMITAFVFSTLFLVGYIAHHALHGDVRYPFTPRCARLIFGCWRATFFWLSWRCRWCSSRFSFRSRDASRSTAKSPASRFRCGSTSASPAWSRT